MPKLIQSFQTEEFRYSSFEQGFNYKSTPDLTIEDPSGGTERS